MKPAIDVLHLFPVLDGHLQEVLQSLSADDWQAPTLCRQWNVKDVAAHLLDGNLRRLSMGRDLYFGEQAPDDGSWQSMVDFLNRLNADWVKAARRISPPLLMELLALTGRQLYDHFRLLAPFDKALFPVAWAGEQESQNWFDMAREYSERWLHQQHIRQAVGKPGLLIPELFRPFLATCMHALPHAYREVQAAAGAIVRITVDGPAGGDWFLQYTVNHWQWTKPQTESACHIILKAEAAWQLLAGQWREGDSPALWRVEGDKTLARPLLSARSFMV